MNRDDLVARVTVATAGWLPVQPRQNEPPSLARLAQDRLLNFIGQDGAAHSRNSRADANGSRLLAEINRITSDVVDRAAQVDAVLVRSDCSFNSLDEPDEDGWIPSEPFEYLSWTENVRGELAVAIAVRGLPANQQVALTRYLLARSGVAFVKHRLADDTSFSPTESAKLAEALAVHHAEESRYEHRISDAARRLIPQVNRASGGFGFIDKSFPIAVPRSSGPEDLLALSKWFDNVGSKMFQPYPFDAAMPSNALAVCAEAMAVYEDCGTTLSLMAAWLRCLAATDDSVRCDICYRHLGRNMKRFCCVHRRTSLKRQRAREQHVSPIYKSRLKGFLRSTAGLHCLFDLVALDQLDTSEMTRVARDRGLPESLVRPAAYLAAYLRSLWPILEAVLQQQIAQHFLFVVGLATRPFNVQMSFSSTTRIENERLKRIAVRALGWELFFATWFGVDLPPALSGGGLVGAGLDVDHPLVLGGSASPGKVALDLSHLRCWMLAESAFDSQAYVKLGEVSRLRQSGIQGGVMPFEQIGKQLGISKETARKTYMYESSIGTGKARRDRRLPSHS